MVSWLRSRAWVVAVGVSVLSLATSLMGRRVPEEVTVRVIRVVNGEGRIVGVLGAEDKGALLALYSSDGKDRMLVGTMDDVLGMAVVQNGETRLNLRVTPRGPPLLSFSDSKGRARLSLGVDSYAEEVPFVLWRGAGGEVIMDAREEQGARLHLRDSRGELLRLEMPKPERGSVE